MEISTQQFERVDIIKAAGRVDSGAAPQLAEALKVLTDAKRYRIVFDMSEVGFLSSAGLRVLLDAQRTCRKHRDGNLVLATPAETITRTLELAGFNTLFTLSTTPSSTPWAVSSAARRGGSCTPPASLRSRPG